MVTDKGFLYGMVIASSIGFLCYVNTFTAEFAYDDNRAILENPDILPSTPWRNIWWNDFWGTPLSHSGSHKSYRPLTVLSFKLNYMAGELDPKGYHLTNVILHSVTSGLVFVLAHSLSGPAFQSLLAGLLFAVHPIHTEAVAGVVGRADILSCMFFILAFISYTKAANFMANLSATQSPTNWKFVFLTVLFSVAATLCKEIGITVLAVCLAYDVIFMVRPEPYRLKETLWRAKARGSLSRIACLVLVAVAAVYWRLLIMDLSVPEFNDSDNPASVHSDLSVRFLTFSYLPVLNFYLLLFPWQLSFDWSMDAIQLIKSIKDARNLESLVFYGFLLFAAFEFLRTRPCQCGSNSVDICASTSDASPNSSKKKKREGRSKVFENSSHSLLSFCYFKLNCLLAKNESTYSYSSKSRLWNIDANDCYGRTCNTKIFHDNTAGNYLPKGISSSRIYEDSSQSDNETKLFNISAHQYTADSRKRTTNGKINVMNESPKSKQISSDINGFWRTSVGFKSVYQDFDLAVFSLAIMIISFIPASNLFVYVGFVIAERILYIPSVGFCLLIAVGFNRIWDAGPRFRPIFSIAILILVSLFTFKTIARNMDWQNEESLYRSGLHINPAKAWGNLGNVLSQQGKLKDAEMAYRSALKARPNMADAHYNLGILLQNTKRFHEAIKCYKSAIHYRPQLASAYLNLGLTYDEIDDKTQAFEILQRGRNLSDHGLKNPKAHRHSLTSIAHNIGKLLFDMGKYKESIATFHDAIDKMPESYDAPYSLYNMLGQSYSFHGDVERAKYWYLKSLKSNDSHVPSHLTYARHLASMGNTKEAEEWFLKAIRLLPENSQSHFHYAEFLHKSNRLNEALVAVERAVKLNPSDVSSVLFAASCFREAMMYPRAEEYYRKAVELNPNDSSSHMNLGAFLHLTRRLDEAKLSYMEALREAMMYPRAEEYYRKAVELNPNDSSSHMNLGAFLHLTRRLDEAKLSYMEALRLDPRDDLTLENLRKLESMQARRDGR